jgi:hypothetical protein
VVPPFHCAKAGPIHDAVARIKTGTHVLRIITHSSFDKSDFGLEDFP